MRVGLKETVHQVPRLFWSAWEPQNINTGYNNFISTCCSSLLIVCGNSKMSTV